MSFLADASVKIGFVKPFRHPPQQNRLLLPIFHADRVASSWNKTYLLFLMKHKIKLSAWAKANCVSRITAWRMATRGDIPTASLSPTGHWLVEVDSPKVATQTVAYARVSSHDQKMDLDRQIARIAEWAAKENVRIDRYVREIGSGLNDQRRELVALLSDPLVEHIVVEHRDRLARFGVAQMEQSLKAAKRGIIVIEKGEIQDDLVRDMVDLMTCFSARLYGRRSAANRAKRALAALRP